MFLHRIMHWRVVLIILFLCKVFLFESSLNRIEDKDNSVIL